MHILKSPVQNDNVFEIEKGRSHGALDYHYLNKQINAYDASPLPRRS